MRNTGNKKDDNDNILDIIIIEEKSKISKLVTTGYEVDTLDNRGKDALIHKQKTIVETIKRMMGDIGLIMEETGVDEDDARRAYIQSDFEINEAIDIAKRYGDSESGSFVNGVLDKINKDIAGKKIK